MTTGKSVTREPYIGRHRRRQGPPAHADPSLLVGLKSKVRVRWLTLTVVALAGSVIAYGQGMAASSVNAAPPPSIVAPDAVVAAGMGQFVWYADLDPPFTGGALQPADTPSRSGAPGTPSAAAPGRSSAASALAANGIPITALDAYRAAEQRAASLLPQCGVQWHLLAAIGRVESDHGRFAGAVLGTDGRSYPPVIGIPLDGNGTARITDTDGGRLDGDSVLDRAVGAMQFIPSTWARYGVDGNGDGAADPFVIYDAAAAAAAYLCAAGGDLTTRAGQVRAVFAYNHLDTYVALVLQVAAIYAGGTPEVIGPVTPPTEPPTVPPVDPGGPRATTPVPHPSTPATPSSAPSSVPSASPSSGSPAGSVPSTPTPTESCPLTEESGAETGATQQEAGSVESTEGESPGSTDSGSDATTEGTDSGSDASTEGESSTPAVEAGEATPTEAPSPPPCTSPTTSPGSGSTTP